jgi:hypothetical protein
MLGFVVFVQKIEMSKISNNSFFVIYICSFLLGIVPTFRRYIKDGKFFNIMCLDW